MRVHLAVVETYSQAENNLRRTYFENPSFLPGNLCYGFAEHIDMVDAQGGDSGDDGGWNNIRAIVSPSNTNLKHRGIDLLLHKNVKCHEGDETEVSRHWWCSWDEPLEIIQDEYVHLNYRNKTKRTLLFAINLSHTWKKYLANSSSEIGRPLIRILSRTATRWGEVYRPTGCCIRIDHPI